jgi:hypothetical protein
MGYTANAEIQDLFDTKPLIEATRRIAKGTADLLHDEVVRRTPIAKPPPGMGGTSFAASRGRTPGALRRAWRTGDVVPTMAPTGGLRQVVEEFNDDEVFDLVEYDTRPHIIRPRKDRAPASVLASGRPRLPGSDPRASLAWPGAGGRTIFAREVHHPGTTGVHFARDGIAAANAEWAERVGRPEMERWAKEQARVVK